MKPRVKSNSELATGLALTLAVMEDGKAWCQGAYARTINGNATAPDHHDAVRWCVSGALVLSFNTPSVWEDATDVLGDFVTTNDCAKTFFTVRRMFERAIAKLEAKGDE
jgi:hypothetical protein